MFNGLTLKGRDWLRRVPKEDRDAFSYIGRMAANHGKMGGIARARTALRDHRGRFMPNRLPWYEKPESEMTQDELDDL